MEESGVSVVVPVYNSQDFLNELAERLFAVLRSLKTPVEILFVNDGSRDSSWDRIRELCRRYPEAHGINLMRNYGQHCALLCGIRAARYELIVTIDDDLQHPPEEIPLLLNSISQGYDVVYGTPQKEQHGLWRNLASGLTKYALAGVLGAETARNVSAFRTFRTGLRQAFAGCQSPYVCIDVLLAWASSRFHAVRVRHEPRRFGQSNYTAWKLLAHTLNMITGFSTWPLRLASLLGFGMTAFGALILAYVLGRYLLEGRVVPGFAFLAAIIAIFSGAQMFCVGIIGEYLSRLHFRTLERPPYSIREIV